MDDSYKCNDCGHLRGIGRWYQCPHPVVSRKFATGFDPVVVFKNKDGSYAFPGHTSDPIPPGCQRVELKTLAEVRKFERQINQLERQRHHDHMLREQIHDEMYRKPARQQLISDMKHMSNFGKALARLVIERSDNRNFSRDAARFEPGFHLLAFSNEASNRPEWHDPDARGRQRK